jgi:hypothetical protein
LVLVFWVVMPCGLEGWYRCSSKMLVSTHKSTRCHNSKVQHRHLHCHENLKPHTSNNHLHCHL